MADEGMELIQEFTYLVAEATGLIAGTDVFARFIPEYEFDEATVIIGSGGEPSKPKLAGNVGEYMFQVLTRATDPVKAHRRACRVDDAIRDHTGRDGTVWHICVVEGISAPQQLGFDSKKRMEWTATYAVRAWEKAAW